MKNYKFNLTEYLNDLKYLVNIDSGSKDIDGIKKVADFFGLNSHTIAKGRQEILSGNIQAESIRKKGGGRKPVEKKSQ